ncbi:cytochrome P450 2C5-like [Mantella aurantiaca]
MNLSDPVTMVLSIILCVFLAIVLYGWRRRTSNFPPGPTPLPLIGNMHLLNLKKPYKTFHELSKKYGPVYSIQIGMEKMVILCGYETVKDALISHADEFSERPIIPLFHEITKGHGVIFNHNENWKVMRRFTISTLRDFGMGKKTIEDRILEESDCLVEKFKSFKGEPFDNRIIINAAVANIIVSIVMSHRFDYEDATLLRIVKMVNENIHIIGSPITVLFNAFPSLIRWLPGRHRILIKNINEIHTFIKETFNTQRRELDINDQRNLIDSFLVKQQEEKPNCELFFTNENLTVLVTDLFSAAIDTTSNTIRWGILLMTTYQDIQTKVQYEIEKVIGSSTPQIGHRKNMPYTDAVIHEIQRFGNIVPTNIPHCTSQDVNFRGYFLPKGTHVIPLLTSVLFDETHFKRPKEFNPEHFLDADGNFMKNEAFLPFSAGKRSCIGETLVKMELFIFFVRLLQTFTFQALPGTKLDLEVEVGFTRSPMNHKICAVSRIIVENMCLETISLGELKPLPAPREQLHPRLHSPSSLTISSKAFETAVKATTSLPELPGERCHNLAYSNILPGKNYPLIDDIVNLSDPVTMVLSIIFCVFLAIVLYGWKRRTPNFPPGPTPLPLIGNMHILNLKKPYKTFYELFKKYGPVYSIQIGGEKMVILSGYETVKDALVNHADEFSDRPAIPLFHEATKGHGEPFDNRILINAAVANIIVSILLSHRFDYEDATLLKLLEIVNDNSHILGSPTAVLYNAFPSLLRWFPGKHRTLIKNVDEIHTFIREIFTIRRKELNVYDQRNLVDAFLVKQQEEKQNRELFFTNENLIVLVTDLFSAAIDTTSNTLRWGILLMTTYPEIQRKVQYEIEKVIGSSAPHTGHRKNMPYTDAVIHEIQRYGNIVPASLSHYTTQDVNFRGYFLPKVSSKLVMYLVI